MNTTATPTQFETRIYNHIRNGWQGETTTAETGEGWQITTLKRSNGLITSTATVVEVMENGCISWTFGAKSITLLSEKAKATEKKINEMHSKAIELFEVHVEAAIQAEAGKNEIYLAAAEGRFFVKEAEDTQAKETPNFEAVAVPAGEVQIIDYSAKAIAVIGETKPIKDKLKELGGKFNFRLSCGAGWIFPKTKLSELQIFLNGGASEEEEEAQEAQEPEATEATTLHQEIEETISFLAEIDLKNSGEVSQSVRECARVQEVEIYQDTAQAMKDNAQFTLFL